MSLFKIVFNFIKKGPIALLRISQQPFRRMLPKFNSNILKGKQFASTDSTELSNNNPEQLFVPGKIREQKDILDQALRNRFPYLSGNSTDMLIRPEDHYIAEYIKRLLKPDPMNYGPKKPFKKWFESLNIQNIEQLTYILDQIPSELVLACTAHPVDMGRASTEQRVVREIQKLEASINALKEQLIGATIKNNVRSQQRIIDAIRQTDKERINRINELSKIDPIRTEQQSTYGEWFATFGNKVRVAAEEIDSREGRATFLVKECFAEQLAELLLKTNQISSNESAQINHILVQNRDENRTNQLLNHPAMRTAYPDIINRLIDYNFKVSYSMWSGDADGHPGVTGDLLIQTSMQVLMRTVMPLLSRGTDYRVGLSKSLLAPKHKELLNQYINKSGESGINDLTKQTWEWAQMLSLHASIISNQREKTAEKFGEFPIGLAEQFLQNAKLLADIEEAQQINGNWYALNQQINKYGLFGSPVGRNGYEKFQQLLIEIANNNQIGVGQPLERRLKMLCDQSELSEAIQESINSYSNKSQKLWKILIALSKLNPSMVIQSDSPADIEIGILTMTAIKNIVGLDCPMTLLFEDRKAMLSIIDYLESRTPEECQKIFKNMVLMSAGSDNQKRMTFMFSDPLNIWLAWLCKQKGIKFKFGRGDSEARSRRLALPCDTITIQPGTVNRFTEGWIRTELLIPYLVVPNINHIKIQKVVGKSYYNAFEAHLNKQDDLVKMMQSLNVSSKAFSRPASKGAQTLAPEAILNSIRAINGARYDLLTGTLNRTFPQNPAQVVEEIIDDMVANLNYSLTDIHEAYQNERFEMLMQYYFMIASAGENDCLKYEFSDAFTIGATDIKEMYKLLTGKDFEQTEPYKDRQDQLENARRLFFNATGPEEQELAISHLELV